MTTGSIVVLGETVAWLSIFTTALSDTQDALVSYFGDMISIPHSSQDTFEICVLNSGGVASNQLLSSNHEEKVKH